MKPIAVSKEVFLNPIEAEQIFLAKDNQFYLGGKLMTDNELWNLSVECDQLVNMQIWSVFQETLKFQAQQLVFTQPGTANEGEKAKGGKWMLYNLQEQLAIVNLIRQASQQRIPQRKPGGSIPPRIGK
jgi:hypothetical protein